ncbi:type II toxin-antitoxin system RelB/DinJ family antitoxin [Finegoldia magna]|uniref:type II toxin-antitoxin system RelB/DinJ family antitoxin n=1 Tax=Finegoldia magna TaxID=1260 RepID=UPI0012AEE600|nr:type II toxin-antitoxin system RelB/DinJ family antitoxin [Finegoldia magna]MSB16568.1 type II toxin-antitoxin system RelB/DinJ family antitoxin [Finegoldia magna]MSD45355.1 type II toxin-antitoxin system RelB/DinJ family antitoxin [Finegoldia magna]
MAQTNINIRIDENLKKQFDAFCSEVGLSMSTAFNIFAKTVVREQRIPFEINTYKYNDATITAINNTLNETNLSKEFSTIEDLSEDLNA